MSCKKLINKFKEEYFEGQEQDHENMKKHETDEIDNNDIPPTALEY